MSKEIYNRIQLDIHDVYLNVENPRFEKTDTEDEVLNNMIVAYEDKIYSLAKHISENGINPTELTAVLKDENNRFIVLDGNRRLTALKILDNPELINKHERLKSKILKLDRVNSPVVISAIEFLDEDEANLWVKLKHTGENGGVGTVSWTALQQSRFDNDKYPLSIKLIKFLESTGLLENSIKSRIKDLKISNLERLLSDPDVRDAFSIKHEKKELFFPIPNDSLKKILNSLLIDLLSDEFSVNIIRFKDDRLTYINNFKIKYNIDDAEISALKDKKSFIPKTKPDIGKDVMPKPKPLVLKVVKPIIPGTIPTKVPIVNLENPSTKSRLRLIPNDFNLTIKNTKINDIYKELKEIPIDNYPNIVGAAFRVFLELSIDYYMSEKKIDMGKSDQLNTKLEKVKNHINDILKLDKNELKDVSRAISSNDNIVSINVLHGYVHSTMSQASSDGLKTTWNNYEHFFELLYRTINN